MHTHTHTYRPSLPPPPPPTHTGTPDPISPHPLPCNANLLGDAQVIDDGVHERYLGLDGVVGHDGRRHGDDLQLKLAQAVLRIVACAALPLENQASTLSLFSSLTSSPHPPYSSNSALATSNTVHSIQNFNYLLQFHLWNSPSISVRSPSMLYSSKTITICIQHTNLCHPSCKHKNIW